MGSRAALVVALVGASCALGGCKSRSAPARRTDAAVASPVASPADPLLGIAWREVDIDWKRPVPPPTVTEDGYAGADACTPCHAEEAERYARHAMSQTGVRPLDTKRIAALKPAFARATPVAASGGFSYRPYVDGGQLFVEELVDGADGKRVHSWTQPITHTFTSGVFGLAFGFQRGDYVYMLPFDWYPGDKRWGLDPSFVINGRFSKPIGELCIACHSDYPAHRPGAENALVPPSPRGVGCERCHGPGAKHVKTSEAADIVNPKKLSRLRQMDVCNQCHLEGAAAVLRAGRGLYSYRPGEPLSAYRVNYVRADAIEDEYQIVGHSERLVRSACWKSSPAMTCTTCHEPHTSSRDEPDEHWRKACLSCHAAEHPCTETAAKRAAVKDACHTCHMRRDTPVGFRERVPGVALPISDHWIRTRISPPAPAGSTARLTPVRAITSFAELTGETLTGDDIAGVHAVALRTAGLVDDAVPEFVAGVHGWPEVPDMYENLGNYYKSHVANATTAEERAQWATAYRLARAAPLATNPDDVTALMNYVRAIFTIGQGVDLREAARAIDRVLALVPEHPGANEEKGGYLFRAGRRDDARAYLEKARANDPSRLQARVLLGVMAQDAGDIAGAVALFEEARQIEPGDRWLCQRLLALYEKQGDAAKRAALQRVMAELDNAHVPDEGVAPKWLSPAER